LHYIKPEKAYVHHLDDDRKTYVDISSSKLEKTKEEISEQISSVLERNFPAKPDKKVCEACDYKVICPDKKFQVQIVSPDLKKAALKTAEPAPKPSAGKKGKLGAATMKKAERLAKNSGVVRVDDNTFKVRSSSDKRKFYTVTSGRCTCRGYREFSMRKSGKPNCSHLEAIRFFLKKN